MNTLERRKGGPIRKNLPVRPLDVGHPHREISAGEEIPHESGAMFEIGDGVTKDGTNPCINNDARAENLLIFFQLAHDEFARLEPPVDVPLGWTVAILQKQL